MTHVRAGNVVVHAEALNSVSIVNKHTATRKPRSFHIPLSESWCNRFHSAGAMCLSLQSNCFRAMVISVPIITNRNSKSYGVVLPVWQHFFSGRFPIWEDEFNLGSLLTKLHNHPFFLQGLLNWLHTSAWPLWGEKCDQVHLYGIRIAHLTLQALNWLKKIKHNFDSKPSENLNLAEHSNKWRAVV